MAFNIALSGLAAAATDLDVTGNNIANGSTIGFKQSRTEFADVFASGSSSVAVGAGTRISNISQQFTQGNIEFTESGLDLAINGKGFFVLDDGTGPVYTRAGSFKVDREGFVVDNDNKRLQVFPPTAVGSTFNTGSLSDVQLSSAAGDPRTTSLVEVSVNIDSTEVPPTGAFDPTNGTTYNHSTSLTLYDSLGNAHSATTYFSKTAVPNEWDSYLYIDGTNATVGGSPSTSLVFDNQGLLSSPVNGEIDYDAFAPGTGAAPMTVKYDFGTTSQFGSAFGVNNLQQDGFASGTLSGIDVDDEGVVFARFSNGQSRSLGQVAMAAFPNTGSLQQLGNSNWAETFNSGNPVLSSAGSSGVGTIQSGALESSNVDLASQLVNLITAQRNFQANAQVIQTADSVTQAIINIR